MAEDFEILSKNGSGGMIGSSEGTGASGRRKCFVCGSHEHLAADPRSAQKRQISLTGKGKANCFACEREGHLSTQCTKNKDERSGGRAGGLAK